MLVYKNVEQHLSQEVIDWLGGLTNEYDTRDQLRATAASLDDFIEILQLWQRSLRSYADDMTSCGEVQALHIAHRHAAAICALLSAQTSSYITLHPLHHKHATSDKEYADQITTLYAMRDAFEMAEERKETAMVAMLALAMEVANNV